MKKIYGVETAIDILKIFAENPYSVLKDLVEDFEINGHIVSVKRSTQYKEVIIDNRYVSIGDHVTVVSEGKEYTSLEYVKKLLEEVI